MIDDKIRDLLDSQDWNNIIKKITVFAAYQFKFWKITDEKNLKGYSPKEIAMEAIEKIYLGEWNWDPEKSDILNYLKYHVIKGLIINLINSKEVKTGSLKELDNIDIIVNSNEEKFHSENIYELIFDKIKDDIEVQLVFKGLYDLLKRSEICEINNWTLNIYDSALKRLDTRLSKMNLTKILK